MQTSTFSMIAACVLVSPAIGGVSFVGSSVSGSADVDFNSAAATRCYNDIGAAFNDANFAQASTDSGIVDQLGEAVAFASASAVVNNARAIGPSVLVNFLADASLRSLSDELTSAGASVSLGGGDETYFEVLVDAESRYTFTSAVVEATGSALFSARWTKLENGSWEEIADKGTLLAGDLVRIEYELGLFASSTGEDASENARAFVQLELPTPGSLAVFALCSVFGRRRR